MHIRAGTSGYSYKEWKGSFYPERFPAKDMLAYYGERLPTVEINNTFYRMPKAEVLETWAASVPEDFRFVIKASRRITHLKRLKDVDEEVGYLFSALEALGARLGAVLFQLPPNLKLDLERLERFLDLLPRGPRVAFEFRHESWTDDAVHDRLRERDAALCVADTEESDPPEILSTASWGYVRLRRADYADADLAAWLDRFRAQDWSDAFVFFKHEDEASGPRMATAFLELAGRSDG